MKRQPTDRFRYRKDRQNYRIQLQHRGQRLSFHFPGDIEKQWRRALEDLFDDFESTLRSGHALSSESRCTLDVLREREPRMHKRMLAAGLFTERPTDLMNAITLKEAFDQYIQRYEGKRTRTNWTNFGKNVMRHLGEDTRMASITLAQIDQLFNVTLRKEYAYPTLHKYRINMKSFWHHFHKVAQRISHNVIEDGFALVKQRSDRLAADKPDIDDTWWTAALTSIPDKEMKALFAYYRRTGARFADPRQDTWELLNLCPSLPTYTRHDAKRGKVIKNLPMHPELWAALSEYRESLLANGKIPVGPLFPRLSQVTNVTIRQYFQKHMARNGVKVWPSFFNTLRANCSRDFRRLFGNATEAYAIGHSETVADAHYDHFSATDIQRMQATFEDLRQRFRIHHDDDDVASVAS
jgi:hypothetical protein